MVPAAGGVQALSKPDWSYLHRKPSPYEPEASGLLRRRRLLRRCRLLLRRRRLLGGGCLRRGAAGHDLCQRDRHLLQLVPHDFELAHHLDEVRHRKVHDVVPPGQLHHQVWVHVVVAHEQRRREALLQLLFHEELQQRVHDGGVLRGRRGRNGVLVQLVLLGQRHSAVPLLRLLEKVGRDTAELQARVALQPRGQRDGVEVHESVDRVAQPRVVALLNVQVVERVVDLWEVDLLHLLHVRLHQRQVVAPLDLRDDAHVVEAAGQEDEHVVQL